MYIFPNSTVSSVGAGSGVSQSAGQSDANKKNVDDKKTTVSIFSNYDTDKSSNVNASEANKYNLFGSADFSSLGANKDYSVFGEKQSAAATQIQKNALNSMGGSLQAKFASILSAFSSNTGSVQYTYDSDSSKAENKIANQAAKLDKKAQKDAKDEGDSARQKVLIAYQSALDSAFDSYYDEFKQASSQESQGTADGTQDSGDGNTPAAEGDSEQDLSAALRVGNKDGDKEEPNSQTLETSKEVEAFASKDSDKNEKVQGKKGEVGDSDFSFNISNIKAQNMRSETGNMASIVQQMASKNYDAQSMYDKLVKGFSVETGSLKTTVTASDSTQGVTDSDIDKATSNWISQQDAVVTKKINTEQADVANIQEQYQNAVDAAYKEFMTKSDADKAKLGYDENAKPAVQQNQGTKSGDDAASPAANPTAAQTTGNTSYLSDSNWFNLFSSNISDSGLVSSLASASTEKVDDSSETSYTKIDGQKGQTLKEIASNTENNVTLGQLIARNKDQIDFDNNDETKAINRNGLTLRKDYTLNGAKSS